MVNVALGPIMGSAFIRALDSAERNKRIRYDERLAELKTLQKLAEEVPTESNNYRWTPLIEAICLQKTESVEIFVTNSANKKNKCGETPLYWAVVLGNAEIVKILLENGADPNLENTNGETPLCTAIAKGRLDLVRILLAKGADRNKPSQGHYPYTIAKKVGNKRVIQHLETFDHLQDVIESHQNYVLIRYWPPRIGRFTNLPYWLTFLVGGNVGHVSMAIRHGDEELYMSHWPSVPGFKVPVPSENKNLAQDITAEGGEPIKVIALYGLDTKKMMERYNEIIESNWCILGNKQSIQKQKSHNCASAVYDLLVAGNLFDYKLHESYVLKDPITPNQVLNLCLKAQLYEQDYYLVEPDRLAKTIEQEFIEAADKGSYDLDEFQQETKPDYINVYKQFNREHRFFFENIRDKAKRADNHIEEQLIEISKNKAAKGSYKWRKFLEQNPDFNDKLEKYLTRKKTFVREIDEIRSQADRLASKRLFTLIDDLKDLSKVRTDDKKERAIEHNKNIHKLLSKLLKNPCVNIALTDKNGLNALQRSILKNDVYCVEKLINRFPEACNKKDIRKNSQVDVISVTNNGIFPIPKNLRDCSPLDLAKYKNNTAIIDLIEQKIRQNDFSTGFTRVKP